MITKTVKLNKSVKVAGRVYWGIVAFPCAAPFTEPTQVAFQPPTVALPLGTWVNPLGWNTNLTIKVVR